MNLSIFPTAYSEKANIEYTKEEKIALVSKLNPAISEGNRKEEDKFEYNKDAGRFVCKAGHLAVRKARTGKKGQNTNQVETNYFDIEKCKVCPLRDGCYKEDAKSKTYSVSLKSETHVEQLAFQKTDEFIQIAKEHYKVEAKNSDLKNGHGYDTSSSAGLFGMEIQGTTTIFAVNLKRILKLMNIKE